MEGALLLSLSMEKELGGSLIIFQADDPKAVQTQPCKTGHLSCDLAKLLEAIIGVMVGGKAKVGDDAIRRTARSRVGGSKGAASGIALKSQVVGSFLLRGGTSSSISLEWLTI